MRTSDLPPDWNGLVLTNKHFGYCKVTNRAGTRVKIHFIGENRGAEYGLQALEHDFAWRPLPIGLKCNTASRGPCKIIQAPFGPSEADGSHGYLVIFDGDGAESARLSERELWPIPGSVSETPLGKLASLQPDSVAKFRAREELFRALFQIDRESADLRALAAGRVALLPHQAFVIGTVVDDPVWRYVLADEVGLGKTVEAGAIAHQLLTAKPDARVVILCPGPLTRQWLCEMHQSFGGRDFRLVDLYEIGTASPGTWSLVISSLKLAERYYASQLLASPWDLVIIDEAHRLLWNTAHYDLVKTLATAVPRLLLLSAIPARERDTELLRLLQLIDPDQYAPDGVAAQRFSELYAAQPLIGRRVRIIGLQLETPDGIDRERLEADVARLLSLPLLARDSTLSQYARAASEAQDDADARTRYRRLLDEVVSRYRISRRILKNRRARLVDSALLGDVVRSVDVWSYEPTPLETQISAVAIDLLRALPPDPNPAALDALWRKTAQALCDPVALLEIAIALGTADGGLQSDPRLFESGAVLDYDEHEALLEGCACAFAQAVDAPVVQRWIDVLRAAADRGDPQRLRTLVTCLRSAFDRGAAKILVFVGTFGTALSVSAYLATVLGAEAVAAFRHDLSDDDKEDEVSRFRRSAACRVLVSDESGGEGRNFQFVDELIHFDLPWSVSAIEQRIGRLDRIGREQPVRSTVICPAGGIEEAWFRCLRDGFGVFSRSISGLEFMLHSTERDVVSAALTGGAEGLIDRVPTIREASERERATDDAESLTDAASFRRSSHYLSAHGDEGDLALEKALPEYLRSISSDRAAKEVADRKDPSLKVWRLSPDAVTDYELTGMWKSGDTPLSDRFGTFRRTVARDRRDLEFFGVGHPLVDALGAALHGHVRGRAFIARLSAAHQEPCSAMLSAWRVNGLRSDGPAALPDRALRRLRHRVVWVGVDLATGDPLDAGRVARLIKAVIKGEGVADVKREQALDHFEIAFDQWSDTVDALAAASLRCAQEEYKRKYRDKDVEFCERLRQDLAAVSRKRPEESTRYARERQFTIDAVEGAALVLDVVGLLKVESA